MANTDPNDPFNPANACGGNTDPNDPFASAPPEPQEPPKDLSLGESLNEGAENLPSSFMSNVGNVGHAIMNPEETVKNLGKVGMGEYDLATGQTGDNADAAHSVNQFYKDRYGSWQGFNQAVAKDPFGVIMDLGAVVDPVAGALGKAGDVARIATNPILATAKGVGAATKFITPKAGDVLAGGAGVLSGTGGEAYKTAYSAGKDASEVGYANSPKAQNFREGMNDKITDNETVKMARDAAKQFPIDKSNEFENKFNKFNDVDMSKNFNPTMDNVFDRALSETGPHPTTGLTADPEAEQLVQKMQNVYDNWTANLAANGAKPSLMTVDNLKRTLAKMAEPYRQTNPNAFRVADNIDSSIRQLLYNASPTEYRPLMETWSEFKNKMKEYNKTLSLSEGATVDTATRKLQSALRDQVNTAFGSRLKLLDELDKYSPGLKDAVSGQTLKSKWPRGVARLGPIGAIGGGLFGGWHGAMLGEAGRLLLSSPKAGGLTAYGLGRAAPAVGKTTRVLGKPFTNPISARAVGIAGQANNASMNYKSPFEDR